MWATSGGTHSVTAFTSPHLCVSSDSLLGLQSGVFMNPCMFPCSKTATHKQHLGADEDRWWELVSFLWSPCGSCVLPCLSPWPNETEFIVGSNTLYWDPLRVCRLTWPKASGVLLLLVKFFFIYTALMLTLSPVPGTTPETMREHEQHWRRDFVAEKSTLRGYRFSLFTHLLFKFLVVLSVLVKISVKLSALVVVVHFGGKNID